MSPSPVNRVLIVDDEPGLVDLFDMWLGDEHETVTATTGRAGLEKIFPSIDAALLDRNLLTVNGSDLATEIRALEADIPIVFVSGGEPDNKILGNYRNEIDELPDEVKFLNKIGAFQPL